jgi:hypothetical protein
MQVVVFATPPFVAMTFSGYVSGVAVITTPIRRDVGVRGSYQILVSILAMSVNSRANVIALHPNPGRFGSDLVLADTERLRRRGCVGRGMSDRLLPLLGLPFRGTYGIEDVIAVIDVIDRPDDHP